MHCFVIQSQTFFCEIKLENDTFSYVSNLLVKLPWRVEYECKLVPLQSALETEFKDWYDKKYEFIKIKLALIIK